MGIKQKRSRFEERIAPPLEAAGFDYEPYQLDYKVHHKYTPDFVFTKSFGRIIVEAKGYFRAGDTRKYKAIRDSMDEDDEFVLFLQSPNKIVRKGTKLTMSGWCEKENITWFDNPEELVEYALS